MFATCRLRAALALSRRLSFKLLNGFEVGHACARDPNKLGETVSLSVSILAVFLIARSDILMPDGHDTMDIV